MNVSGGSSQEIMEHIHKPQNALMHQKIQKVIINGVTPILTGIIQEGIEHGLFSTPYPYECMEMVVTYANTVFDDDMVKYDERGARFTHTGVCFQRRKAARCRKWKSNGRYADVWQRKWRKQ